MDKKLVKKKILITGANGFVGYNACQYFLDKGWEVFGIVSGNKNVPTGVKIISLDLLDFEKLRKEINRVAPSVVLHLGAHVVLDRSFEVAQRCVEVNIKGTLNLLEIVKDLNLKKFIFFSTEEVYGKGKLPYDESQVVCPPSPYAISKVAGENFCRLYHNLYKLPVVIFRLATIFGYYQPTTRFIAGAIVKAINNQDILLNSGKNKRDYIFVGQLLKAIDKAVSSQKGDGEIFNIGHSNPISGKTLVEKIIKLSKSKSRLVLNAFPDRQGEAPLWAMKNKKAKSILAWRPEGTIDKYLKETINFYKNSKINL